MGRGGEREREKVIRWWSDPFWGVTKRFEKEQALEKTRSRTLPFTWVGGEGARERSNEDIRDVTG